MPADPTETPIACTLAAGDFKARVASIADLNRRFLRRRIRHDLRLELVYDCSAREEVLAMVRGEQSCCAFLSFEVRDDPGLVRVVIQAPDRARGAAEAVFAPFLAEAPASACGCGGASG